jgi:hypothetical protein
VYIKYNKKNMNKILIFWWLAVFAVLLIENMVMPGMAYVLWFTSRWYMLVLISALVWFFIWYWFKWFLSWEDKKDDWEMDF